MKRKQKRPAHPVKKELKKQGRSVKWLAKELGINQMRMSRYLKHPLSWWEKPFLEALYMRGLISKKHLKKPIFTGKN